LEISEHMEVVGKIKGVFNKGVNGQR